MDLQVEWIYYYLCLYTHMYIWEGEKRKRFLSAYNIYEKGSKNKKGIKYKQWGELLI